MKYKNHLTDLVVHYLSTTYSFSEIDRLINTQGADNKAQREKNMESAIFAIKKLITDDARRVAAPDAKEEG